MCCGLPIKHGEDYADSGYGYKTCVRCYGKEIPKAKKAKRPEVKRRRRVDAPGQEVWW
jgi:hypothetical protein